MDKKLENQPGTKRHMDDIVNKWLYNYINDKAQKHGDKERVKKEITEKGGFEPTRVKRLYDGDALSTADDVIKLSKATGISPNEILDQEDRTNEIVKKPSINNVDIFTEKQNNVLYKHMTHYYLVGGKCYEPDDFIKFLGYLIEQEDLINKLSATANDILDNMRKIIQECIDEGSLKIEQVGNITSFQNYDELNKKLNLDEFKGVKTRIRDIRTSKGINNSIRHATINYISKNIK